MPCVWIKSLPLEGREPAQMCQQVADYLAEHGGYAPEHVAATWELLASGCYVTKGLASSVHTASHPIMADVVTPDFMARAQVTRLLKIVADGLSETAGVPHGELFLTYRAVKSGHVFDQGKIVEW